MRRILLLVLAALLILSACTNETAEPLQTQESAETTQPAEAAPDYTASQGEIDLLEGLYAGRTAFHGDLHDHADTGGTSDGNNTLYQWKDNMLYVKDMDYVVIVDHKQVLHMRLPEWEDQYFIGGSEAGTRIRGLSEECTQWNMHYNMIFAEPEGLERVVNQFPLEYQYFGDHFINPDFERDKFMEVVKSIQDNGGFFVHVHPRGDNYIISTNAEDYWFGDSMGFEVLCGYYGNMSHVNNMEARQYWVKMLDMGKRVFATSGSDSHRLSNTVSLSTIYCKEQKAKALLDTVIAGDFTAGPVGIRSCIGENVTGSVCSFSGQRLVIAVDDFHSKEYDPTHTYRMDVYTDEGLVASQELTNTTAASYFSLDTDPASRYYRVEVYDVTEDYIFALGNPIWNEALYQGNA